MTNHTTQVHPATANNADSVIANGGASFASRTIYCARSGVPLLSVTSLVTNAWPVLSAPQFHTLVHPTYNFPIPKLIRKLESHCTQAEACEWNVTHGWYLDAAITMSALLYALDAVWMPHPEAIAAGNYGEPSIPPLGVVAGTASRLLSMAKWYHYQTSKRIALPLWRPSSAAGNAKNWHGFSGWLDTCEEIQADWATRKAKAENKELLSATDDAVKQIRLNAVFTKIDVRKVWNWIDIQLAVDTSKFPAGRRATLKSLFLTGEDTPEDWTADDCDDLIDAVATHCDIGNDITHFIRQRVSSIRAGITDFYSNFTMTSRATSISGGLDLSESEKQAEAALFAPVDEQVANMTTLPPKPTAESHPNKIALIRATAEWNILRRRFESRKPNSTSL